VLSRLLALGTQEEAREQIVEETLRCLDSDSRRIESEVAHIRQRLGIVQTEIQNLVDALKRLGQAGVDSVGEELAAREAERKQLREQLGQRTEKRSPVNKVAEAGRRFLDTWKNVGEMLREATPEERGVILRH